jgi:ketosteroid isomerase-like protein
MGLATRAGPGRYREHTMTATMTTTDHVTIVSELHAAFGRGDLDGMLAPLAEDVSWDADWADLFSQRAGIGVVAPRHGIDGALRRRPQDRRATPLRGHGQAHRRLERRGHNAPP